jgi:Zn-finger nucleic acid-binding protein/DNA-directed RNA polymerase subunit RPC12/RpoP
MSHAQFASSGVAAVELDICWPCHLIWFDSMESTVLSPNAVVELFRQISQHSHDQRKVVSMTAHCPVCRGVLKETRDFVRGGRFTYRRCESGHGRATAFTQFLIEKQFIRTLAAHEIKSLAATVKQIRCSSCGAPVNIEHDEACTHCGSPIAVLDRDAVAKALADYEARQSTAHMKPLGGYDDSLGGALVPKTHVPQSSSGRGAKTTQSQEAYHWSQTIGRDLSEIANDNNSAKDLVVAGVVALIAAAFK